ncbi:NAD(P)-dependent oxidoreductase [Patulibacter americanus]|uniref:NAD(P)-dependent oxidoreductase n=1 Tax=Patulibacter americanus TaxID=588672 RepID=UPI0003B62B79|nr:NAD(P)-dependent oxidoreductase [Patulibacter americanus]
MTPPSPTGDSDVTLVLVPEPAGLDALADVPGVRALAYDPRGSSLPGGADAATVVVVDNPHAETTLPLLRRLPQLRLVQNLSAGFDPWDGRVPDGVAISNARGAHGRATAELAVALLLATLRELPAFADAQARRSWEPQDTGSLAGARVLVLGAGDLGAHVGAMVAPFGATATLVGRTARDGVVTMEDVPALLPQQDAVVVVLPLTEATRGTVDAAFLGRMKDGAVLVNAGRGPLVDTDALLRELHAGRLRAALDVTDPEPLPEDHPLWTAPGLLITPHVGGDVRGWQARQWAVAAAQVAAFARGERPENLVAGELP